MEKLFEKLFSQPSSSTQALPNRRQSLAAFKQLYHLLPAKQPDKATATLLSLNQALLYLNGDLSSYKKVIRKILASFMLGENTSIVKLSFEQIAKRRVEWMGPEADELA